MEKVDFYLDNKLVHVNQGLTILQACTLLEVVIPRFCYHEKLAIAGNCRMCLVEVFKSPKPVASCAMPIVKGMKVFTKSSLVQKAREAVLDFLLINHPLDCPICDQAGECDLQDETILYGHDRTKEISEIYTFLNNKRAVSDKNLGPFVKTVMTRCIHCTRCVRFLSEIAGIRSLGMVGRGAKMQISTYLSNIIGSELSGNIIDLCPVGALTSKPYAFTARSWELRYLRSLDLFDAVGINISIYFRGNKIMRILPFPNAQFDDFWLTDRTRFFYDGLNVQRLENPLLKINGVWVVSSWRNSFNYIRSFFLYSGLFNNLNNYVYFKMFAGDLVDLETLYISKKLTGFFGTSDRFLANSQFITSADCRYNYILSTKLNDFDNKKLFLLFFTNPRYEAPLLNITLRKLFLKNNLKIISIGSNINLTYYNYHINNSKLAFVKLIEGRHWLCNVLNSLKKNDICGLLGFSSLNGLDGLDLFSSLKFLEKRIGTINILNNTSNKIGALELGFIPGIRNRGSNFSNVYNINFCLGASENFNYKKNKNISIFSIYQGHHGGEFLNQNNFDVILPTSIFIEKKTHYLNIFGNLQSTNKIFSPLKNTRKDWEILIALGNFLKKNLKLYNTVDNLNLFTLNQLQTSLYKYINFSTKISFAFSIGKFDTKNNKKWKIINFPFRKSIVNFFKTNIILLNSENLNGINTKKYQKYLEINFNSKFDNCSNLNEVKYAGPKNRTDFLSLLKKNSIFFNNQLLKKLFKKVN